MPQQVAPAVAQAAAAISEITPTPIIQVSAASSAQVAATIEPATPDQAPAAARAEVAPGMMAASTVSSNPDARQRILNIARGEIGVREEGGEDRGERISQYRASTRGSDTGGSWCADFASWVYNQNGTPIVDGNGDPWTVTIAKWAQGNGRWHDKGSTPQPGDMVFFKYAERPNFVNHVEIVESVDADGTIHTIGGNSSDQVKRNTFEPGNAHIVGFVDAPA